MADAGKVPPEERFWNFDKRYVKKEWPRGRVGAPPQGLAPPQGMHAMPQQFSAGAAPGAAGSQFAQKGYSSPRDDPDPM